MAASIEIAESNTARRWQFGLRGVLVMTFWVALALADFRLRGGTWSAVLPVVLTALSVVILFGLSAQIRDFGRNLAEAELSPEERFGLRFAIAWRVGAALLLVMYHVLDHFDAKLFDNDAMPGWPVQILYYLGLIAVFSGARQLAGRRKPTPTQPVWRRSVIGLVCIAFFSVFLYSALPIHFLVHLSLIGIEMPYSPLRLPLVEGVDPLPISRAEPAFWLGMGAAILVPVTYWLIHALMRDAKSPARRKMWAGLLVVIFASMTAMFAWNYFVALPAASPFMMAQSPQGGMWHFLLIGVPCLLFLTTAIAYRITAWSPPQDFAQAENRTKRERPYLHERRCVAGLLAIILAAPLLAKIVPEVWNHFVLFPYADFPWLDVVITFPWLGFSSLLGEVLIYAESGPALFAFVFVGFAATFAHWKRRHTLQPVRPPALPPARFILAWVAVTATTVVALPVLAIYGFALWMAPWYVGDWLALLGL